ncbi:MAG: YfcE family phosphodiesterase [Planctomycetota bacterium]|nr:YfcE family phosphodiesterase [Planctomycetota bacterium]
MTAKRILVLSDSHMTDAAQLPNSLLLATGDCDRIIHCGDITSPEIISALQACDPPVSYVLGNMDDPHAFPDAKKSLLFEMCGMKVGVVHGLKASNGPLGILKEFDERPDLIFYGHTHRKGISNYEDTILINPGSVRKPKDKVRSYAIVELTAGEVQPRFVAC